MTANSITCPACERTSFNTVDIATGWCCGCEVFAKPRAEVIPAALEQTPQVEAAILWRLDRYGTLEDWEA